MQEYGRYLNLFRDTKRIPQFAVLKKEMPSHERAPIQTTSSYTFFKSTSEASKFNIEQEIKIPIEGTDKQPSFEKVEVAIHPCIKLPLLYSQESPEKPPIIYYSITEKGTLQSLFNYYQDLHSNQCARFCWDFTTVQNNEDSVKDTSFSISVEQKYKILLGIASACLQLEKYDNCIKCLLPSSILLDEDYKPHLINTSFPFIKSNGFQTDEIFISPTINKEKPCESLAYSFGYIAYFLLSEKQPFYYVDFQIALSKISMGQVPMFPGSLPSPLFTLLTQCCDISPFFRPSFDSIICVLYNLLQTPTYISYANEVVPPYIIASAHGAKLGENSPIFKKLMETTDENAAENLFECSQMAAEFPVNDNILSMEFMRVSARTGYVHARRRYFLMLINGFAGESDKNKAFKTVKEWKEENDMEAAVLLAHCFEKGIGGAVNLEKANQTIKKAKSSKSFSATYEFGRFTIDGIGAEKETSSGEALQKEAFNDHHSDDIYSYLNFLLHSPFKNEMKIYNFLTTHQLTKNHPDLVDMLMRIMMTTTKSDGSIHANETIHDLAEKATVEGKYLNYLLTIRNRNLRCEKLESEPEKIDEAEVPPSEQRRRRINKNILAKIVSTRKLNQNSNKNLQKSEDPVIRAKAILCSENRDIALAENILEDAAKNNIEVEILLNLLRLSLGLIPYSLALEKLHALGDNPEAKNALAYYYMYIENKTVNEIIDLLEEAADAGSIVAGFNYACILKNSKICSPEKIMKSNLYEKRFFEQSPPAFFGVFESL
ncbi:hypothetical protein TVAG_081490 [Trichomonas vaginalis G3]|uniref:Protein kinase domain-containing protein n=1 Tax=Trichomonas vaginalis (strain ATCC PRA-98 / G3) TaxID=412133 RepID=A2E6U1_TRIV3|nr:protein kinase-like (PK-like) family [Trichomonas vaginalis G3]EAY11577.1 hypothetical protein TVAG_081490 [Trichomonas vaginalis G3]KAI5516540.1 protein kinase-like (PK-like) family [Trichomonas vaginalis G3]|eukprot:XP_001323800.1 hypothetical protein [Trichomonas vaginalis G3]